MSLKIMAVEMRKVYARYLLMFAFFGFLMKIVSEFVHEIGHVFTVLMLGGKILSISIRAEWPFTLSYTKWTIPNPSNINLAMVAIAGILFEIVALIVGQSILLSKKNMQPIYAIPLFWLSFWTYLSSVVYLLIGAFHPFGDILDLVNVVAVPNFLIGIIGLIILIPCTYLLSLILRNILSNIMDLSKASDMVSYFWTLIYTFYIFVTIITYGLPIPPTTTVAFMLVLFIWSYICSKWVLVYISELRSNKKNRKIKYVKSLTKNSVLHKKSNRKLNLVYNILFFAAIISVILTAYTINQYLSTYSVVIKTGIEIEVINIDIKPEDSSLNLSIKIINPTSKKITLDRIEFDINLNNKFMKHHIFDSIPLAKPESNITFNRVVYLPKDRMFTIDEAIDNDSWDWTVSGASHVQTMFGETILRFKSESTCEPKVI